jgi:hypothetical protein
LNPFKLFFMKKNRYVWALILLLLVCLFAIGAFQGAIIKGTVQPLDAVTNVWALSGRDTFSGSVLQNAFEISKLRSGTYTVIIEAEPPYKKAVRENIVASDGQVTDVGEIILEK